MTDSGDWAIGNNPDYTHESVLADMTGWFTGPKSPGINSLEHEIKDTEVDAFLAAFPVGKENGWDIRAIPDAFNQPWYINAESNTGEVSSMSVAQGTFTGSTSASASASTSSSGSSSASASSSASGSASTTSASGSQSTSSTSSGASSGAANSPSSTSAPNGAAPLVIGAGAGSLWALMSIITAMLL